MGRGLIQITGRANHRACGAALGFDPEAAPAMLEGDALAARSACWFWASRNLNALADAGDFEALTRKINGGTNGLADRKERWARAKQFIRG
ncbi:Phage lysozyme [Cupriavidus basilensis]|uniref:Phage lysozyme n=2 Tax=Cupriavidus basilensis TaxID=68895 RepID=A0A0C4YFC0_9BURK|nr:Phage lysozyme [Cupriavidus basilensis]